MPFHVTTREIALVFMVLGVTSLVLHEPLAKLDKLLVKGGPFAMEQGRHRTARLLVIGVGVLLMALALALIVR